MATKRREEVPDAHALQSQIRDLAALLALSAMWRGRDLQFIAGNLLDTLVSLLRVDLAYLRLEDPAGAAPLEQCRPVPTCTAAEVGNALHVITADAPERAVHSVPNPIGEGVLQVIRFNPRMDR